MSDQNPIQKKNYSFGSGAPLREFNVSDPSINQNAAMPDFPNAHPSSGQISMSPEESAAYMKYRQEKLNNKNQISAASKSRSEILANIGRLSKDVVLDGVKFSIRTLKNKETQDATMAGLQFTTNIEIMYEARKQFLARSIYKIDDVDFDIVLGSHDLEKKMEEIDTWEEVLVAKLYDEFDSLREEVKTKYFPKTDAELKEVAEEIKK